MFALWETGEDFDKVKHPSCLRFFFSDRSSAADDHEFQKTNMTDAEFVLYPTSFTQWWAFKRKTIPLWGKHFIAGIGSS